MHHFGIIIQFENQRSQRSIPPSRPRGFSSLVYQETISSLLFCLSVTGADPGVCGSFPPVYKI